MSAGRIVDAMISSISAAPGRASISTTPTPRMSSVAGTGVWVRGLTLAISRCAGKRRSRAIAKTCRAHAAITTMPAPNIAKTMQASRIRSATGPSCSRMIAATGDPSAVTA